MGILKNLLLGKPAFEEPKQQNPDNKWDNDAPTADFAEERQAKREAAANAGLHDESGVKQIPVAQVAHVKYDWNEHGDMEIWAAIRNNSQRDVELDKFVLLGQKVELDYRLSPGGQRDFRLYRGKRPNHDSYKKAELYYKDVATGDYFLAEHIVEYKYEADKTYGVVGLELITPIRDV